MAYEVTLTSQQVELLTALVEASNSAQREFFVLRAMTGTRIAHPVFGENDKAIYGPDLQALEDLGFLTVIGYDSQGKSSSFDVSPAGRQAYSDIHAQTAALEDAAEDDMCRFIDASEFRHSFPAAHERWAAAAKLLWSDDTRGQLTEVGHYCREALQEFADVLVGGLPIHDETKKTETIKRLKAWLGAQADLGATTGEMLEALVAYWGTVSDLAQRQEHASSRKGEPLEWEDARRLVFQTLVVMYEVARLP
jgi:hypothetical protein